MQIHILSNPLKEKCKSSRNEFKTCKEALNHVKKIYQHGSENLNDLVIV